ncbi:hypothetical protein SNOG_01382 [Parastagonospora nodorum SN15]|uniref:Uncharacterized protein n=1 Tax=Phaeosphaeria nodorum (strain SN15 / ATCC MYA-4574 / FGSC 10173) TaxID=321614 RepID=Q0V3N2_PHANO|nr:hypothetical protein SNOG_01382 [Parastagonospora nodorum SN15]EAT91031.1 hypothetical protein SNOG_01382 [Parastagonospora nodorum SN15]
MTVSEYDVGAPAAQLRNLVYEIAVEESHTRKDILYRPKTTPHQGGYLGLTQACRTTRTEFRPLYLGRQTVSIHFGEAQLYLDTFYPFTQTDADGVCLDILLRTRKEHKRDYPTELGPLLRRLLGSPQVRLSFQHTAANEGMFNIVFTEHAIAWKEALRVDIESIYTHHDHFGNMQLTFKPTSTLPWLPRSPEDSLMMSQLPEESVPYFEQLGFVDPFEIQGVRITKE